MLRFCLAPSVSVLLVAHSVPRPPGARRTTANSSGARAARRGRAGPASGGRAEPSAPRQPSTARSVPPGAPGRVLCMYLLTAHSRIQCSAPRPSGRAPWASGRRPPAPSGPRRDMYMHMCKWMLPRRCPGPGQSGRVPLPLPYSGPKSAVPVPVARIPIRMRRCVVCSRAPHGKIPSFPINSMKSRATRSMYCSQIPLTGRRWPRLRQLLPCRRALGPSAALLPSP